MRITLLVAIILFSSPLAFANWEFSTLQGEKVPLDNLYEGKWCLAFVVAPECLACAVAIGWLKAWQEEQTASRIQVALVVPWDTPELRESLEGVPFPVIVDPELVLASWFKVKVAPTVALFAEGAYNEVLTWPFTEGELRGKLRELQRFVIPRPQDLLGNPPPELVGTDLAGRKMSSGDIPHPALLFFFSPTCPACRASLETMDDLSRLLPVVLVVLTKGHELTPEDIGELKDLQERYGEKLIVVLLGDREKEVMDRYRIRWTPTFFLVDAEGMLRKVWEGPSETLVPELEELLAGGTP
ncbi:redoxin domain-containing protein [Candidatus Bipolaricaulota sp. J31]